MPGGPCANRSRTMGECWTRRARQRAPVPSASILARHRVRACCCRTMLQRVVRQCVSHRVAGFGTSADIARAVAATPGPTPDWCCQKIISPQKKRTRSRWVAESALWHPAGSREQIASYCGSTEPKNWRTDILSAMGVWSFQGVAGIPPRQAGENARAPVRLGSCSRLSSAQSPRPAARARRENIRVLASRPGSASSWPTVAGRRYDQLAAPTEPGVLKRSFMARTSVS